MPSSHQVIKIQLGEEMKGTTVAKVPVEQKALLKILPLSQVKIKKMGIKKRLKSRFLIHDSENSTIVPSTVPVTYLKIFGRFNLLASIIFSARIAFSCILSYLFSQCSAFP